MEKQHYFLIETKLGKTYITRLYNEQELNLTINKINEKEVLINFPALSEDKFILLEEPIVMVPQRGPDGKIQTLPVRISDAPMGSTHVTLAVDLIAEINVLDSGSDFVTKLRAQESGLYTGGSVSEAERSSQIIHKYSKR